MATFTGEWPNQGLIHIVPALGVGSDGGKQSESLGLERWETAETFKHIDTWNVAVWIGRIMCPRAK